MKLVSVNVGLPRLLAWGGATFETGIFKNSVEGRVMLRTTNLDGDRQADLSVHGGANKAVYCYPYRTLCRLERRASRSSPYLGSLRREFHYRRAPRNDRFHRRQLPRGLGCGQGNDAPAS